MLISLCACGQKGSEPLPETSGTPGTSTSNPGADASSDETDADTAYQDKQKGDVTIEITPPDGWTKNESSVLPLHYMKGTASFMVKEEPSGSAILDDVVN